MRFAAKTDIEALPPEDATERRGKAVKTMRRIATTAAVVTAFATVALKWIMTVLVRKLLRKASTDNSLEASGAWAPFWRVVFLDHLSFRVVVGIGIGWAFTLVLSISFMQWLATLLASHNSQLLRKRLLENYIDVGDKGRRSSKGRTEGGGRLDESSQEQDHQLPPSLLIRQITIIEDYKANHEFFVTTEKIVISLCLVLTLTFSWQAGVLGLLALGLSEYSSRLFKRYRRPVLDLLEEKVSRIHAHLLDVLKNSDEVIVARTREKEMATLRKMQDDVDPIVSDSARLHAFGNFFRIIAPVLVPILIALLSWPLFSSESPGDSVNDSFGVIAALLLLDEGHKSLLHLTFMEEKRLDAENARKQIEAVIGSIDDGDGSDGNGPGGSGPGHNEPGTPQDDGLGLLLSVVEPAPPGGDGSNSAGTQTFEATGPAGGNGSFPTNTQTTEKMGPAALVIKNLSVRYPGTRRAVIESLNLELQAGKIHGIVGDNGCGKSTMVKVLAGLIVPEGGIIRYHTRHFPKIAYMPQASSSTLFARTVRENISYGREKVADEEIWKALELAEVDGLVRTLPGQLDSVLQLGEGGISGGERQRLQLARLFCTGQDSELVLVDEGLSELDPTRRDLLLKRLCVFLKGKTAVVVTHHSSVTAICDDVHRLSRRWFGTHHEDESHYHGSSSHIV